MNRLVPLAWLLAVGCVAIPVPEPPNLDRVTYEGGTSMFPVDGAPGAVAPDVDVWIMNVDGVEPATIVRSSMDGSFNVNLSATPGDELRLQVRTEEARSVPLDVRPPEPGPIIQPLGACLSVELELDLGETATGSRADASVSLRNDCAESVSIAAVDVRVPGSSFGVDTAAPFEVPAGGAVPVAFRFEPSTVGPAEEIARITIDAPEMERRAITLFGRGRAP